MKSLHDILALLLAHTGHAEDWSSDMAVFPTNRLGICGNVDNFLAEQEETGSYDLVEYYNYWGRVSGELKNLFDSCPLSCNSVSFPVGGDEEFKRDIQDRSLWKNPKRMAMLKWLVENSK